MDIKLLHYSIGEKYLACAVTVISRRDPAKGMTLAFVTIRPSFSIPINTFPSTPLSFLQWILRRAVLSDTLTWISGGSFDDVLPSKSSSELEQTSDRLIPFTETFLSSVESLDFVTRTTDSTVFFTFRSSKDFTVCLSSLTYLIVSPRMEALSACKIVHWTRRYLVW